MALNQQGTYLQVRTADHHKLPFPCILFLLFTLYFYKDSLLRGGQNGNTMDYTVQHNKETVVKGNKDNIQ